MLQYYFCFIFCFFGHEACEILVPWPGIEPALPALDGEALTTGPPGKYNIPSLGSLFIFSSSKRVNSMTLYDPWFPVSGYHYRTSGRMGLEWRLVMKKCVWLKGGFAGGLRTQWGWGASPGTECLPVQWIPQALGMEGPSQHCVIATRFVIPCELCAEKFLLFLVPKLCPTLLRSHGL